MLSKSQIKLITSLAKKKYRKQHQFFVVEGIKSISEFLKSEFQLHQLFTIEEGLFSIDNLKSTLINETEFNKISFLTNPNKALAIFKIPEPNTINTNQLIVALDNVSDPGNLGTIIRLCDWFGISNLVCSLETVDCYNPKVVQASMGSLTRVNVNYVNLEIFLEKQKDLPLYGTFMKGENIYSTKVDDKGVLVLGNEANGIRNSIEELITKKISIPRFGKTQETESLNVATAASILLSEFKRRSIEK